MNLPESREDAPIFSIYLGPRIVESSLDLYLSLVEAQYSSQRRKILRAANLELEKLRHLLRLAHDLNRGVPEFVIYFNHFYWLINELTDC